jgi:hypothetical protein
MGTPFGAPGLLRLHWCAKERGRLVDEQAWERVMDLALLRYSGTADNGP